MINLNIPIWTYLNSFIYSQIGCWAGNLMIRKKHHDFPSDVFLTLLAADGVIKVGNSQDGTVSEMNLVEFLKTDMSRKLIISLSLPKQKNNTIVRFYNFLA